MYFIDQVDDRNKLWRFRFTDGSESIGHVDDFARDTSGKIAWLKIWNMEEVLEVPYHAIVHVREYRPITGDHVPRSL